MQRESPSIKAESIQLMFIRRTYIQYYLSNINNWCLSILVFLSLPHFFLLCHIFLNDKHEGTNCLISKVRAFQSISLSPDSHSVNQISRITPKDAEDNENNASCQMIV